MRILHMLHALECETGNIGVTVRKGPKWANSIAEVIDLCVCDGEGAHEVQGRGVVVDNWYGKFLDIPAKLIEKEHEKRSRLYSGLLDSMQKAYGKDFTEEDEVVIVTYNRLE